MTAAGKARRRYAQLSASDGAARGGGCAPAAEPLRPRQLPPAARRPQPRPVRPPRRGSRRPRRRAAGAGSGRATPPRCRVRPPRPRLGLGPARRASCRPTTCPSRCRQARPPRRRRRRRPPPHPRRAASPGPQAAVPRRRGRAPLPRDAAPASRPPAPPLRGRPARPDRRRRPRPCLRGEDARPRRAQLLESRARAGTLLAAPAARASSTVPTASCSAFRTRSSTSHSRPSGKDNREPDPIGPSLLERYEERLQLMVPADAEYLKRPAALPGVPEKAREKVIEKVRKYLHVVEFAPTTSSSARATTPTRPSTSCGARPRSS